MTDPIQLPSVYYDGDVMVVRASSSGMCVRALSAIGRYEEVVPIQRQQLLDRTAQEGNLHEGTVVDYMRGEGYDVSQAQDKVTLVVVRGRIEIRGHIDGAVLDPFKGPAEVKSMSKSRFDTWQRHGLAGFSKYQWQLSSYWYGWADQTGIPIEETKALYGVKRRDDGLIDLRVIDRPPIPFQDIRKKMVQVQQHRKAKTLPACTEPTSEQWWCPFPFLHEEDVEDMELPDETVLALEELVLQYDELREIENTGKEAGARKRDIGAEILKHMDGRLRVELAHHKISHIKQQRESVDLALLKADMAPAELAKYQKSKPVEYPKVTKKKEK
jgi:hypothetical protein